MFLIMIIEWIFIGIGIILILPTLLMLIGYTLVGFVCYCVYKVTSRDIYPTFYRHYKNYKRFKGE